MRMGMSLLRSKMYQFARQRTELRPHIDLIEEIIACVGSVTDLPISKPRWSGKVQSYSAELATVAQWPLTYVEDAGLIPL